MKPRTASFIVMILLTAMVLTSFQFMVEGEKTSHFYTNSGSTVQGGPIELTDGGGMETSYYFKVGKNVPISHAYFNISTRNTDVGMAIEEPYIDIGVDGQKEWEYTGIGYGKFGEQEFFDDDKVRKSMNFPTSGGYNSANSIIIPENAQINEAEIEIRGRFIPQSINSYQVEKDPSSISIVGYAMEHGDIDKDGDIDIVLSDTKNYRILWFENPSNITQKWPMHTVYSGSTYIYNVYSLDVGDMDGDGDIDVVATSYSRGYVMYIENTNQGNTWRMHRFYTGFPYAGRVRIADMDQDGNPDVVVASYYNYRYYSDEFLYWFEAPSNPNTNYGWTPHRIDSSPTYYIYSYLGMDVGDLNGDGYPDVTMSLYPRYTWYGNYNRIYAYINPKTGTSFSRYMVDSSAQRAYNLAIGDMTGDGIGDIVAASYDGGRIKLYNNTNKGVSWTESNIGSMSYPRFIRIVDFDDDGKNDTIAGGGSGSYELASYIQGSTTSSWTKNIITKEVMNPMAFSVFDMDDDDDLDFLVSGTSASQLVHIETLNNTTPQFNLTWLEDGGVKDVRAIDFHDMNGDGKEDIILVGYSTGWVGWCENDGTPFNGAGTLHKIGSIGNPVKVMAANVDGDDDMDIVALSSGGVAIWFENRGDPYVGWEPHQIASGITSAYSMYAGDFTGDGKADLATSSARGYYGGFIRLYKAPSDPRVPNWPMNTIASSISYLKNIWADDMDLDGDLDVLAAFGSYGSGAVVYYRNPLNPNGNPMSGRWSSVSIGGGMYYTEDVKTIDITDDGWPDVVTTGSYYYSKVNWFENPAGGGSFTKRVLYSGRYNWNLAVGDIGNDGYADIVFNRGSYSGPSYVYWYEEPEDYTQGWIGHSLGSYSGTWALGISDLDGDDLGDILSTSRSRDEIRAYKINAVYPQNVELDVGGDETSADWYIAGELKGATTLDFKQALQDVIDTEPSSISKSTDQWGTTLLNIPFEVYSSSLGKVGLEDIFITYNATVKIDQNGAGKSLATVLDRIIPDYVDNDQYLRIYVGVGGGSAGQAYLSDLSVEYNAIPRLIKPLPDFKVDEDSKITLPFDVTDYFSDDYTPSDQMKYRISLTGPNADKIQASIVGNKVVLDSTITQNFYSRSYSPYDIKGRLIVEDGGGPNNVPSRTYRTNEFPIIVEPVNDPPIRTGESLPLLKAYEGQDGVVADLDDYDLFFDVDGDKLNFMIVPYFDESYDEDVEFNIKWIGNDNTLFVELNEYSDWTGDVKARIYATDQAEFNLNSNPFVDFIVQVLNVNDGPHWNPIEDRVATEDVASMRIMEISQYVEDIDTPRSELDFYVESYTNISFLTITYERTPSNHFYINFEPRADNWNGRTTVTLSVSDGEFEDQTSFDIDVQPVNDIPLIRIVEPVENGRVEPGFFSVVGEAHDVEGIEYIEVYFSGKWVKAQGLNTWGVTLEAKGTDSIQEGVAIQARVFDGTTYTYDYSNITIMPLEIVEDLDYDEDGYPNLIDAFPYDPSEWSDRDGDGVGDNTDRFPDHPQWWDDSDGDTIADQADTHPLDPELWDDKDNDGRNDFLPPINKGNTETDETNYIWPILLFVFAGLLLAVTVLSLVFFIRKRDASKDPRKMAKYYAKQQRMREARHNLVEKLPLAKLADRIPQMGAGGTARPSTLPTPTRPGMATPSMVRPSTVLPGRPAPALPPRRGPIAPTPIARPMQAYRPPVRPPQ